jgi:PleD family two-component response regulator
LGGKPPFSGATLMAILLKHRDGEIPSLASVCLEAPPELDDLYRRMMAKTPEKRVQQMSDVVAELSMIAAKLSPAARVAAPKLDASSMSVSFGASTNTTLSKMSPSEMTLATETGAAPVTVLVVEPSRVQASIIKGYLQEHSLSVMGTAANGKDAIKEVHSLRPRAVVSAMYLSDMSGIDLAQQIRSEIKVDAPGFVLITSESEVGESASLSKLNRVLTLAKPFTANQLIEALNLVTGASTSWRASDSQTQGEFQTTLKRDRAQLRVLIVDDSSPARIHVRNALQSHGFQQFLEVPDGAYAIAVAAQEIQYAVDGWTGAGQLSEAKSGDCRDSNSDGDN